MDKSLFKKLALPQSQAYFESLYQMSFAARGFNENSIIFFAPIAGFDYRFRQIERYAALVQKDFEVISFALQSEPGVQELAVLVKSAREQEDMQEQKLCVIVKLNAAVKLSVMESFFALAQEIYLESACNTTFCIYADIALPQEKLFYFKTKYRACFQNVFNCAYYADAEVLHFLKHTATSWSIKPKREILNYFLSLSGGVLYFAKQLMRIYAKYPKANYKKVVQLAKADVELQSRVSGFMSAQPEELKNALVAIANGANLSQELYQKCLSLNLITVTHNEVALRSLLIKRHILSQKGTHEVLPDLQNTDFSGRERAVLKLLFANLGQVVKRESIASHIWGESEYQDITLDQVINRIRKKIATDKTLKKYNLRTHKKIGFELTI